MKSFINRRYAVEKTLPTPQTQKTMVGMFIRGSLGMGALNTGIPTLPARTFRVRRGNGYAGSVAGEIIQDQFDYNVSDPDADNIPLVEKLDFAAAVLAWQLLSDETKDLYNTEAKKKSLHMSGYNLYISKYRLGQL